jgi:hypothetical protein
MWHSADCHTRATYPQDAQAYPNVYGILLACALVDKSRLISGLNRTISALTKPDSLFATKPDKFICC